MRIFISYRRAASAGQAGRLKDRLVRAFGEQNVFMDVDKIPAGETFESYILREIERCDVFLAMLSEGTLGISDRKRIFEDNDLVRREFAYALLLSHVRVIPVLIDNFQMPRKEELPKDLHPLLGLNAVFLRHELFKETSNKIIQHIKAVEAPSKRRRRVMVTAILVTIVMILTVTGVVFLSNQQLQAAKTPEPFMTTASPATAILNMLTQTAVAHVQNSTLEAENSTVAQLTAQMKITQTAYTQQTFDAHTDTPTVTFTSLYTPTAAFTPTQTANLTETAMVIALGATEQFEAKTPSTNIPLRIATVTPTHTLHILDLPTDPLFIGITKADVGASINVRLAPSASSEIVGQLEGDQLVRILEINNTGDWYRIEFPSVTEAWISVTLVVTYPVNQPPRTGIELKVQNNGDWQSNIEEYAQVFDRVEMVLVPAGCFMMGSTEDQISLAMTLYSDGGRNFYSDETPSHQICFSEPFWIDKYEVSNMQYGSHGYWSEVDMPRESINWIDAKTYCENRDARLPTEAEWEYAARGPDDLIFPWGNIFIEDNVVYGDNSDEHTMPVGSKLGGVSWVGAKDLSGNVWEWVSTRYDQANYPYPYQIDGRDSVSRTSVEYVLRGGSWQNGRSDVRSANRNSNDSYNTSYNIGFRCARDWQPEE